MQKEFRGPRGNVIQQNLKWGHVVSEVSLDTPAACSVTFTSSKIPDSFDFDKHAVNFGGESQRLRFFSNLKKIQTSWTNRG